MKPTPRPRLLRLVSLTGGAAAFIILSASGSHAEEGAGSEPSVTVAFNSNTSEAAAAMRAIASHLEDLKVTVVVEPVAGEESSDWLQRPTSPDKAPASVGKFYVDFRGGGEILVYFTEPGGESTLIRRLRPKSTNAPVALEEAGIVVRSLLEALLDGGRVGVSVSEKKPPPAAPPPPRPPARPLAPAPSDPLSPMYLGVAVRYSGTSFLAGQGLEPGAYFGLRVYPGGSLSPFSLGAGYTVSYPSEVAFSSSQISLQRHPFEVGLTYASRETLGLLLEIMAVGDFVGRKTLQAGPNLERTEPRGRWVLGMSARGGGCLSPSSVQHWCLTAGLDAFLDELSYAVITPEAANRVSSPRVRPRLDAGLTFDFL